MGDTASDLNQRIAERVRELRAAQGLSLDALASESGVSRSERHRLREGDCLATQLDRPTRFHNPTRKPTRYAVVMASETPARR